MGLATKAVSVEEYLSDPAYELFEYIDGEPVELNVGTIKHAKAQANCSWLLKNYFEKHPGGYVAAGVRCRLVVRGKPRFYVPDVAIVFGDAAEPAFLDRAPDVVVEIRSPGETVSQQLRKLTEYVSAGSKLGWLIEPEERSLMILAPGAPLRVLLAGETADGGDVMPGLSFSVDDLFA